MPGRMQFGSGNIISPTQRLGKSLSNVGGLLEKSISQDIAREKLLQDKVDAEARLELQKRGLGIRESEAIAQAQHRKDMLGLSTKKYEAGRGDVNLARQEEAALLRAQEQLTGVSPTTTTGETEELIPDGQGGFVQDFREFTPQQATDVAGQYDALALQRKEEALAAGLQWDPETGQAVAPSRTEQQLAYNRAQGVGDETFGEKVWDSTKTLRNLPSPYDVVKMGTDKLLAHSLTENQQLEVTIAKAGVAPEVKKDFKTYKAGTTKAVTDFNKSSEKASDSLYRKLYGDKELTKDAKKIIPASTKTDSLSEYTTKINTSMDKLEAKLRSERKDGKISQTDINAIRKAKVKAINDFKVVSATNTASQAAFTQKITLETVKQRIKTLSNIATGDRKAEQDVELAKLNSELRVLESQKKEQAKYKAKGEYEDRGDWF